MPKTLDKETIEKLRVACTNLDDCMEQCVGGAPEDSDQAFELEVFYGEFSKAIQNSDEGKINEFLDKAKATHALLSETDEEGKTLFARFCDTLSPEDRYRFSESLRVFNETLELGLNIDDLLDNYSKKYPDRKIKKPEDAQPEVVQPQYNPPQNAQPEVNPPQNVQPEIKEAEVAQPQVAQPEAPQQKNPNVQAPQQKKTAHKKNVPTRPSRSRQIEKYFNGLKTDREKIDFLIGLSAHKDSKNATSDEKDLIFNLQNNFLLPKKPKTEELDNDLFDRRIRALTEYRAQLGLRILDEYKRILRSLPDNEPNAQKKADYLISVSQEACEFSLYNGLAAIIYMDEIEYADTYKNYLNAAMNSAKANLPKNERDLFDISDEVVCGGPRPNKELNLTLAEQQAETSNLAKLLQRADMNWMKDETMKLPPKFLDSSVSEDHNDRMFKYYMTLQTAKDRAEFIADMGIALSEKDQTDYVLSAHEKEEFKKCVNLYLNPTNEKGEPDPEAFKKNMDTLAKKIVDYDLKACDYANNNDLTEYTLNKEYNIKAAPYLSNDYLKGLSILNVLNTYKDLADKDLVNAYKTEKGSTSDSIAQIVADEHMNLIGKHNRSKEILALRSAEPGDYFKDPQKMKDVREDLQKKMLSNLRSSKPWYNPEFNISMDSLKRMDNLYEQLKDSNHWYHWDSSGYTKLRDSLAAIHIEYVKLSDAQTNILSPADRIHLLQLFDDASDKALKYMGNAKLNRGSDLGKERVDISLSVLGIVNKGTLLERLEKDKSVAKENHLKVNLDELMERSGRTNEEQKAYKKTAKKVPKQKEPKQPVLHQPGKKP